MTTPTLHLPATVGQYQGVSPIQAVARAGGWKLKTARQMVNPSDERCPFTRAALITESLIRAGHLRRAEALCSTIDLARIATPITVDRAAWEAAAEREQLSDGCEDVAQIFIADDPVAYDTWRRRALDAVTDTLTAVRVGDVYFARAR